MLSYDDEVALLRSCVTDIRTGAHNKEIGSKTSIWPDVLRRIEQNLQTIEQQLNYMTNAAASSLYPFLEIREILLEFVTWVKEPGQGEPDPETAKKWNQFASELSEWVWMNYPGNRNRGK